MQNAEQFIGCTIFTKISDIIMFATNNLNMIKISHLAIDSTDQNYDKQAKGALFRNRLQRLLFLVSIAGTKAWTWA